MSAIKQIMLEMRKRADVNEFLRKELSRAGYGGVDITKTPLGTRVTIYAMRPGIVIGRGGEGIRNLSKVLEEKYKLFNPQIAVGEVQVPELNPYIVASKITAALERGVHFRRACYWALNSVMNAGALGAEIKIGGKLTTERARREKFRAGYIPKVGDPVLKHINKAVVYTQLKPGLFGVQVMIIPPTYKSPDQVKIKEVAPAEAVTEAKTVPEPGAVAGAEAEAAPPAEETEGEAEEEKKEAEK